MHADSFEALIESLQADCATLAEMTTAVAALVAQGRSKDRLVSVSVDAYGHIIDLQIDPSALRRYRAEQLATTITRLHHEAMELIIDARNRLARKHV